MRLTDAETYNPLKPVCKLADALHWCVQHSCTLQRQGISGLVTLVCSAHRGVRCSVRAPPGLQSVLVHLSACAGSGSPSTSLCNACFQMPVHCCVGHMWLTRCLCFLFKFMQLSRPAVPRGPPLLARHAQAAPSAPPPKAWLQRHMSPVAAVVPVLTAVLCGILAASTVSIVNTARDAPRSSLRLS